MHLTLSCAAGTVPAASVENDSRGEQFIPIRFTEGYDSAVVLCTPMQAAALMHELRRALDELPAAEAKAAVEAAKRRATT